eukprot:585354-Prymnesium_polylepis.1
MAELAPAGPSWECNRYPSMPPYRLDTGRTWARLSMYRAQGRKDILRGCANPAERSCSRAM